MAQILVVDDEVGIRELLSEILSDEGHSVQLAENATAARSLRARGRPDLVLLDIWMPDADGITLLKEWATGGPLSIANFGRSMAITELKKRLARISATGTAVLMRGEKGVMPELYARYLQQPNAPWIDAAQALNEASQDLLQQVSSGVLFVGELAMLSKNQQKHLAFLAARAEKSNVRLVSFTAEEPKHLVESLGFDAALMQALAGIVSAQPGPHQPGGGNRRRGRRAGAAAVRTPRRGGRPVARSPPARGPRGLRANLLRASSRAGERLYCARRRAQRSRAHALVPKVESARHSRRAKRRLTPVRVRHRMRAFSHGLPP